MIENLTQACFNGVFTRIADGDKLLTIVRETYNIYI